jgi:hypothetical protein
MNHHGTSGKLETMLPSEARGRLKEVNRILALKEKQHAEYLVRHEEETKALQAEKAELEAVE